MHIQHLRGPTHSSTEGIGVELGGHGCGPVGICTQSGRGHQNPAVPRPACKQCLDPSCPNHIRCQAWEDTNNAIINQTLPSSSLGLNLGTRILMIFTFLFRLFCFSYVYNEHTLVWQKEKNRKNTNLSLFEICTMAGPSRAPGSCSSIGNADGCLTVSFPEFLHGLLRDSMSNLQNGVLTFTSILHRVICKDS